MTIEVNNDWTSEPARWLIQDWLPAGCVTVLIGADAVGKSRLALQLAAAIATGTRDWMPRVGSRGWRPTAYGRTEGGHMPPINPAKKGAPVEPCHAVVAAWEYPRDEVARRLRSVGAFDADASNLEDRLHFVDMVDHGGLWAANGGPTRASDWLQEHIRKVKARLLVIDHFSAAFDAVENRIDPFAAGDPSLIHRILTHWNDFAKGTGCTVLVTADPSLKLDRVASCLWTLEMKSGPLEPVRGICLDCIKSKYAASPDPLWLASSGEDWYVR